MSLALYADEHVPIAIVRGLQSRQIDVFTVQQDAYSGQSDQKILDRASELQRVLFTRDEDLLRIARDYQLRGTEFSGVIYAHQLGPSLGRCIEDLELIAKCSSPDEMKSKVTYLPLR